VELILKLSFISKRAEKKIERGRLPVEQLTVLFALFFFTVLGSALALFSSFPLFPGRGKNYRKKTALS